MKISCAGITGGKFDDAYGKRGPSDGAYSPPITIEDAPEGTVCYALVCEDKDAVPVCGFSWIHWLAANIKQTEIPENASAQSPDFIQGANSECGGLVKRRSREQASRFGGFAPPDAPHVYEIHVFALDTELPLRQGFYMNELYKAMEGHVLAQATVKGVYDS